MHKFSPHALQILALSRKEAVRLNHAYVGTEHLLLGLLYEADGIMVNMLKLMGYNLEAIRVEVEKEIGSGPLHEVSGDIPYTPRAKKVFALAHKEAKALNHPYVGSEHILLGLLREGEGVAACLLIRCGVDIQRIYKEIDPNYLPQTTPIPVPVPVPVRPPSLQRPSPEKPSSNRVCANCIKEYKRTCNECGKVWHSLVEREEKLEAGHGCAEYMCGDYHILRLEDGRSKDYLEQLHRCPICGSANYDERIIEHI